MSILTLKSNLANFKMPVKTDVSEAKKIDNAKEHKIRPSTELVKQSNIKINKVDNSTSIMPLNNKKVDYNLIHINKNNKGIILYDNFKSTIKVLPKKSLFNKVLPKNILKISEFNKPVIKDIPKVSKFVKVLPASIIHKTNFQAIKPNIIAKISKFIKISPNNINKTSLFIKTLPISIIKSSLYVQALPANIIKISPVILPISRKLAKISKFIKSAVNNSTSLFDTKTKILKLTKSTNLNLLYQSSQIPVVNFFNDLASGAKGFIRSQQELQTAFIGISGNSYTYPKTVKNGRLYDRKQISGADQYPEKSLILFNNRLSNTKYQRHFYTDKDPYTKNGKLTNTEFNLGKYAVTRRSPSPLEIEYTAYNLQNDSYQINSLFKQPFVLRGIQRVDNPTPQVWGFGAFDDGMIRGGAVTSAERAAVDVFRIGKFLASTRGLSFILKQQGLYMSGPNTEAGNIIGTKGKLAIGNGITSLIGNIATQHLGLRYRKDSILTVPNVVYSDIFKLPTYINRLERLKTELLTNNFISSNGGIIPSLSGIGGPRSVYGLGITNIKRYYSSNQEFVYLNGFDTPQIAVSNFNYNNRVLNQNISESSLLLKTLKEKDGSFIYTLPKKVKDLNSEIVSEFSVDKKYTTLSYNELMNRASLTMLGNSQIRNFLLKGNGEPLNDNIAKTFWIPQNKKIQNYLEINQHKRPKVLYPDYGKHGKDLRNPVSGSFMDVYKAGGFGMIDPIWKVNQQEDEAIDDFVKFMFHDLNTNERFRFRAYIENINESYNPEMTQVKIAGRADSAYIYQGFDRNVSISFKVAALSRGDLMLMWDQLERLAKTTLPKYSSTNKMIGPLIKFTIGNWFNNMPAIVRGLSYSVDNETPWEINIEGSNLYSGKDINSVGELPKYIDVQLDIQVLGSVRPESNNQNDNISANNIIDRNYYNPGDLYSLGNDGIRKERQEKRFI